MAVFSKQKYLKLAKGFLGIGKSCPKVMIPRVHKSLLYAYKSRHMKRRNYRAEWIATINQAARELDLKYNVFMHGLRKSNLELNRNVLSQLAIYEPSTFRTIVDEIKIQANILPEQYLTGKIATPQKKNPLRGSIYPYAISLIEGYGRGLIIDAKPEPGNSLAKPVPLTILKASTELMAQPRKRATTVSAGIKPSIPSDKGEQK